MSPTSKDDEQLHTLELKLQDRFTVMDRRFDELVDQLESYQGCIVELFRQTQEKLKSIETLQMQHRPPGTPGRILSARGGSHRSNSKQLAEKKVSPAEAGTPLEIVPLLLAENGVQQKQEESTFHERLKAAQEAMATGKGRQGWWVKTVTQFLEDPESSFAASCYENVFRYFNLFAIFLGLLPLADCEIPNPYRMVFDVTIDCVLQLEIIVRFAFCPNFLSFFETPANIVDIMTTVPLVVQCLIFYDEGIRWWGEGLLLIVVPVIRLLRLIRRFPDMQILITAFRNSLAALPVLLYTLAVLACFFTTAIFLVETRDNIESMSQAAWMVLATMTTVGYGDFVPHTKLGHALTSVLMIVSPLYMAMPFGIIGFSFTDIWAKRSRILLLQGTRDRLAKWGFGPYEIPRLFALFDLDASAEIDLQEFQILLGEMEIGFKEEDIVELFKAIDKDSGGTIDEKEFVKTLYPTEYRFMYGKKKGQETNVTGSVQEQ